MAGRIVPFHIEYHYGVWLIVGCAEEKGHSNESAPFHCLRERSACTGAFEGVYGERSIL